MLSAKHENYYFNQFKEQTPYGSIKVQQGILKEFPVNFQIGKQIFFTVSDEKCQALSSNKLKSLCDREGYVGELSYND